MKTHVYYLSGNYDSPYDDNQIGYGRNLGDCSVIELQDSSSSIIGIVDFGRQLNSLSNFIKEKNIKHIDFCIISHYHGDHIGGEMSFLLNYIKVNEKLFKDCVFYLPHGEIEWNKFTNNLYSQKYQKDSEKISNFLKDKIVYPIEDQKVDLTSNAYLTFYNLDQAKFNEYYNVDYAGDVLPTSSIEPHTSYNNFSLVTVLTSNGYNYLFSGDIEKKAQELIADQLPKIDVYKVEHHGLNFATSKRYLEKLSPQATIIQAYQRAYGNVPIRISSFGVTSVYNKGSTVYETIKSGRVHVWNDEDGLHHECATGQTLELNETNQTLYYNNLIPENSDLDLFLKPGNYYAPSAQYAKTIKNIPIENSFNLTVIKGSGSSENGIVQKFEPVFTETPRKYKRMYQGAAKGWTPWRLENSFISYINTDIQSFKDRSTDIKGGYQQVGNLVYVNISFTNLISVPVNDYFTFITGLPPAKDTEFLTGIRLKDKKRYSIAAWVTPNGSICIQDGWAKIDVGQNIQISGTYLAK